MRRGGALLMMWLSGIFTILTCVHGIRLIYGLHVFINGIEIPFVLSTAIVVISAPLAIVFAIVGIRARSRRTGRYL